MSFEPKQRQLKCGILVNEIKDVLQPFKYTAFAKVHTDKDRQQLSIDMKVIDDFIYNSGVLVSLLTIEETSMKPIVEDMLQVIDESFDAARHILELWIGECRHKDRMWIEMFCNELSENNLKFVLLEDTRRHSLITK